MTKRKVAVVTGTRAEYGLLYWLLKEIASDDELHLQIIVTGSHLSSEFGLTYRQIEADGFRLDERVEMLLSSDTRTSIVKSLGLGTIGFADAYRRLEPDIVVILGDRYEMLAAAQAALIMLIPIAHLHGGELTEGAVDDAIRHSLTKMSQLHFTAAESYRERVIQLGEQPARVFNVGAPGLDHISRLPLLSREELAEQLEMNLSSTVFLITFHPATLEAESPSHQVTNLLEALDEFPDATLIFTMANADADGRIINALIEAYVARRDGRAKMFAALGQLRYLNAIRHCDVVIGNSSSGLTEAPALKKATVNIGDRQKGRLKAASIIDCETSKDSIVEAINEALSPAFRQSLNEVDSLYGMGDASSAIKTVLKSFPLNELVQKRFFDK